MTKYILCGGYNNKDSFEERLIKIKDFYSEIISDINCDIKILLCHFAKEDSVVEESIDRLKKIFAIISDKNIVYTISDKDYFYKQILESDIIIFLGGRTEKLLNALDKNIDYNILFKNKIIAGESAGANILCSKSYSPRAGKVFNCLGLLPIKLIPHYNNSYESIFSEEDGLKLVRLKEYEYITYSIK